MPSSDAKDFFDLIRPWGRSYRWIETTYFALKSGGTWHLRHGQIVMASHLHMPVRPIVVETQSIFAGREIREASQNTFEELLASLASTPLRLIAGNKTLHLPGSAANYSFFRKIHPAISGNRRIPALRIIPNGISDPDLPAADILELELLANDPPIMNLDELRSALTVPPMLLERNVLPVIDWVATPPAWISEKSSNLGGDISIVVEASQEIDPNDLRINYRVVPRRPSETPPDAPRAAFEWQKKDDLMVGTHHFTVRDTPLLGAFLKYRNEYLGHWWVQDPTMSFNHKYDVHRVFDDGVLASDLSEWDPNQFDAMLCLVLGMLGLNVLRYSKAGSFDDAPDILAFSNEDHLFVIECTTGDIGRKGKLERLHKRAQLVRDEMSKRQFSHLQVVPVLCTNLSREQTRSHWSTAEAFRIALVCKEEITQLISRLGQPPPAKEIYEAALRSIPRTSPAEPTLFPNRD